MTLAEVDRRGAGQTPHEIAPGVHLLAVGRGIAASNVYLVRCGEAWALIDAGWAGSAETIEAAAESLYGPGSRPAAVLLTHIHPDHSGSAGQLARAWGVPVYAHPVELPMAAGRYLPEYGMPLDRWVVVPLMRLLPAARREQITAAGDITDVARPLGPGGRVPGLADWEWIPAPGHTPGQVAYLRRSDGVLLTGDAVLTVDLNSVPDLLRGRHRLAGPPRYTTWNPAVARRSVAALAELRPRVLGPGHGPPMTEGTATALQVFARRAAVEHRDRRLRLPLADPGAGRYRRPPRWYSRMQWLGHALTFLGLTPRYVVTLEVPGRRSGVIRRTNLVRAEHEGEGYLVSLTGESEWVRNVRAAGGRVVLSRRGRRQPATLVELPAADRAPVIRSYVLRAGRQPDSRVVDREARTYLEVGPELDLGEIGAVADRWPVFRVVPEATGGTVPRERGRLLPCLPIRRPSPRA